MRINCKRITSFCLCLHPNPKQMWRTTLDSSTMRALRLRSFLFSSSSSSSSSCCSLINIFCPSSSSSSFTTLTTIISHSFLPFPPTTRVLFTDSRRFGSPVPRCVSSLPTLDWNDAVSCSEVEVDANAADGGDDGAVDQDTKPSIAVRAFFFSTRYSSFTSILLLSL